MKYYTVVVTYEIWDKYRDEFLETMKVVRDNAIKVGALAYYLTENDDAPNKFSEVMVFDSWSHFKLIQQKQLSSEMEQIFDRIASWTIGGLRETEVTYQKVLLGESWQNFKNDSSQAEEQDTEKEENSDDTKK